MPILKLTKKLSEETESLITRKYVNENALRTWKIFH